jgi:hypothetical protein
MIKDNIKNDKREEKREKLKKWSLEIVSRLHDLDISASYTDSYISPHGHDRHDFLHLLKKLENCSSGINYLTLQTIDYDTGVIVNGETPIEACTCHEYSLCPMCASKKRSDTIKRLRPFIKTLAKMKNVYIYSGTITIEGSQSPGDDYNRLRNSWTRFVKLGQKRENGYSFGESKKFLGTFLSIEIIPEKERIGYYHVHGHLLIVTKDPLEYNVYDQDKKHELINRYGYGKIPKFELDRIAVKKIDIKNNMDLIYKNIAVSKLSEQWNIASKAINFWVCPIEDTREKTIEDNLYEIVKYECKPWEIDAKEMIKIWDSTHGKRKMTASGIFTNNKRLTKEFRDLLIKNNLVSYFNEFNCDPTDILGINYHRAVQYTYNYNDKKYDKKEIKGDFSYLTEREYLQFLQNRAYITNEYRSEIKNIKNNLKIAMLFCPFSALPEGQFDYQEIEEVSRLDWIRHKREIEKRFKEQMKSEFIKIKRWIYNRSAERNKFLQKTTNSTIQNEAF